MDISPLDKHTAIHQINELDQLIDYNNEKIKMFMPYFAEYRTQIFELLQLNVKYSDKRDDLINKTFSNKKEYYYYKNKKYK